MHIIKLLVITSIISFSTSSYSVEITPLLGFRGGGEFVDIRTNKIHTLDASENTGLILGLPQDRGKYIEIYYSRQSTNISSITLDNTAPVANANIPLTIDYLHIGGTTPVSEEQYLQTFVSGGFGFTYLSPDFPETQSDLRASFSLGIGLKWPIAKSIAIRLETRGLATLYNNNSAIFCNGGCSIAINGNYFLQAEVLAGLVIKF